MFVFAKWNGRRTWKVWIKCVDGEAQGWRLSPLSYHFPQFINSHGRDLMTLLPTSTLPLISLLKIIDPFEETNQPFQKSHQNLYVSGEKERKGCLLNFIIIPFETVREWPNSVSLLSGICFSFPSLKRAKLSHPPPVSASPSPSPSSNSKFLVILFLGFVFCCNLCCFVLRSDCSCPFVVFFFFISFWSCGWEFRENGVDFWDLYGGYLWDCIDGRMAAHDEAQKHQKSCEGKIFVLCLFGCFWSFFSLSCSNSCIFWFIMYVSFRWCSFSGLMFWYGYYIFCRYVEFWLNLFLIRRISCYTQLLVPNDYYKGTGELPPFICLIWLDLGGRSSSFLFHWYFLCKFCSEIDYSGLRGRL